MVMRQTNYSREMAESKLDELKDPILVIRQYLAKPAKMDIPKKDDPSQLIHRTIQKFMEEAFEKGR